MKASRQAECEAPKTLSLAQYTLFSSCIYQWRFSLLTALHVLLSLIACLSTDHDLAGVAQVMNLDAMRFSTMSQQHKEAAEKVHSLIQQHA